MRHFQCKNCDRWNQYSSQDHGKVVNKDLFTSMVHGKILPVIVYTVECSKCGRSWIFRRRRKK